MPRMLDLIRASAVPANLVQAASRGALSIPPAEMIEVLVHLATQSKVFGEQATMTLAGWDEKSSRAAAADPNSPKEVLQYLACPQNLRPTLLPDLLANPAVTEEALVGLAGAVGRENVDTLLKHERIIGSQVILTAMASNPNLSGLQSTSVEERLKAFNAQAQPAEEVATPGETAAVPEGPAEAEAGDLEEHVTKFFTEHADELATVEEKAFQPIGGIETLEPAHETAEAPLAAAATASGGDGGSAAGVKRAPVKKSSLVAGQERGSALQKISKLDIKGRIQLAMKGTKEERGLLVRDGTKIVALAVLDSPKVSDGEVEKFATQKNVLEAVLRAIPMKRRYMKNYIVVRNLVFNPRTPLDVGLGLMKNLLTNDLKNLSANKEISETVRKLALKMFKQKLESNNKK